MLTNPAIYEATQLVNILSKNNVALTAAPLTPLETLTKASVTGEMSVQLASASLDEFGALLKEASQARGADGALDHDMATQDTVELLAANVARNLDLAKNTVNPICLDVLSRISTALENQVARDVNNVAIIPDFYREVWNSPILANIVEPFADVAPEVFPSVSIAPNLDDSQIAELLVTGAGPLDADIADLVASRANGSTAALYREVFGTTNASTDRVLSQVLNPFTGDRDEILLVFIIARRLVDEVPDGVNMNLADYRMYVSKIQAQAGFALNRVQALRERDLAARTLLRKFPEGGAGATDLPGAQVNISVNGAVYNQWLEAGGRPEVILGAFIADGETQFDKLLENAAVYTASWNRHLAFKSNIVADEKYSRVVAALNLVMTQVINEQQEAELAPTKDAMRAALREHTQHITRHDVDNLAFVVRKLVCRTLFAHYNAEAILNSMDAIATQYPDMDINEVGLFAALDHIVSWIAKENINVLV